LQAGVGQDDGILVEPDAPDPEDQSTWINGLRIKGITIEGFPGNGIHLRYVNDFRIDKNESINNLENGIFPTLSANGTVKQNISYGSQDSALWVESSENVRVLKNVLHSSPTGLEVTVSNNLEISGNEVYNNTVGIGLYHPNAASLPPLAGEMVNWEISNNYVHDNNAPNMAPPGSMSSNLPPGGGILILGTDGAIVTKNVVENNDFYGIAIVDWCLAVNGSPFDCDSIPPLTNPFPEFNDVQGNEFINNGTNPDPDHPLAFLAADITYLVLENLGPNDNCFAQNDFTTIETLGTSGPDFPSTCL
jgi:parallel beta-helix repeat protein